MASTMYGTPREDDRPDWYSINAHFFIQMKYILYDWRTKNQVFRRKSIEDLFVSLGIGKIVYIRFLELVN